MSILDAYPKTNRNHTAQLRALLQQVPGLGPRDREDLAAAMNSMADKAWDLNEIFERLLREGHDPCTLAELLTAFQLTTEQLRGDSDMLDGKLYDCADRLKRTEQGRRE
jgi:hypothetical protein